jgi:hypothetical protein
LNKIMFDSEIFSECSATNVNQEAEARPRSDSDSTFSWQDDWASLFGDQIVNSSFLDELQSEASVSLSNCPPVMTNEASAYSDDSIFYNPEECSSLLDSACVSLKRKSDKMTREPETDSDIELDKKRARKNEQREINRLAAFRYRHKKMLERKELFIECELYRRKIEQMKKNVEQTLTEISDIKSQMLERYCNLSLSWLV